MQACKAPGTLLLEKLQFALAVRLGETGAECLLLACCGLFKRFVLVGGGIGQGVVAVVDCLVGRGACMVAVLVDRHSAACGGESIACVCVCVCSHLA